MTGTARKWSTEGARNGHALTYWNDVVDQILSPMRVDSSVRDDFHGEIIQEEFGPVDAFFVNVCEQEIRRTTGHIGRAQNAVFELIQPRKGRQYGKCRGNPVSLDPGDCILVHPSEPFEFAFPDGSDCLSLQLPASWLRSLIPDPDRISGRVIARCSGWGATLVSALLNFSPGCSSSFSLSPVTVAEQIAMLLALAGGAMAPATTTHKDGVLRRMRDALREHYHDAEFDTASLARLLGISRRYVHVLFASVGSTFGQELMAVRLERAREVLADKRFSRKGIGEIAWCCGFTAPSHFAARFRERYGVSPRQYRDSLLS
jgi:AraC-like DNA-binding protein